MSEIESFHELQARESEWSPEIEAELPPAQTVQAEFVIPVVPLELDSLGFTSNEPAFEAAVRTFLANARYAPATLRGRPVRIRVSQSFDFRLEGNKANRTAWPPPFPTPPDVRPR